MLWGPQKLKRGQEDKFEVVRVVAELGRGVMVAWSWKVLVKLETSGLLRNNQSTYTLCYKGGVRSPSGKLRNVRDEMTR